MDLWEVKIRILFSLPIGPYIYIYMYIYLISGTMKLDDFFNKVYIRGVWESAPDRSCFNRIIEFYRTSKSIFMESFVVFVLEQ